MHFVSQTTNTSVALALNNNEISCASHTTMEVTAISNKILDIIFEYALNKFDSSMQQLAAARPNFLSVINRFIVAGTQVEMALPAFPFKSANKIEKVLGTLPDKAEELALQRLNTMCVRIGDVYAPGAKLTIISDGLVYNGMSNAKLIRRPYLKSLTNMAFWNR